MKTENRNTFAQLLLGIASLGSEAHDLICEGHKEDPVMKEVHENLETIHIATMKISSLLKIDVPDFGMIERGLKRTGWTNEQVGSILDKMTCKDLSGQETINAIKEVFSGFSDPLVPENEEEAESKEPLLFHVGEGHIVQASVHSLSMANIFPKGQSGDPGLMVLLAALLASARRN